MELVSFFGAARRGFFCCAGSLFVAAAVPEGTVSTPAKTKSTADETKLAAAETKLPRLEQNKFVTYPLY